MLDMSGRRSGAFFMHWFEFLSLASEARDRAKQVTATASPGTLPSGEALGAILFSALATEAFINELPEAAARDADLPPDVDIPGLQNLADLAATLDLIEEAQGQIDLKYQLASKILTGKTLDPGKAPFQDFANLIKLRNDLVHPRHRDRTRSTGHVEPISKVVRVLQRRGLTTTRGRQPHDPRGGASWLLEIESSGVANWAYAAAREIITALIEMLPDDWRFTIMDMMRGQIRRAPK